MYSGDEMKKQKMKYNTEETNEIMKFLIVLVIVILLIVGVFFLSKLILKEEAADYQYQSGTVKNNIAIVGTILNQPEKEYYILAYDTKGTDASAYVTYAEYYTGKKEKATKIYYLDLSSAFNKDYYVTDNSNPKAQKISDLKIKDGTLLKISNGKITEYIEGLDELAEKLKVEK